MAAFEYRVVYMDFRGRISIEGEESFIEKNERRSTFARRVMNALGEDGWELVGIQQLWPAETSYLIFKRVKSASDTAVDSSNTQRLPTSEPVQAASSPEVPLEPRGPVEQA